MVCRDSDSNHRLFWVSCVQGIRPATVISLQPLKLIFIRKDKETKALSGCQGEGTHAEFFFFTSSDHELPWPGPDGSCRRAEVLTGKKLFLGAWKDVQRIGHLPCTGWPGFYPWHSLWSSEPARYNFWSQSQEQQPLVPTGCGKQNKTKNRKRNKRNY